MTIFSMYVTRQKYSLKLRYSSNDDYFRRSKNYQFSNTFSMRPTMSTLAQFKLGTQLLYLGQTGQQCAIYCRYTSTNSIRRAS